MTVGAFFRTIFFNLFFWGLVVIAQFVIPFLFLLKKMKLNGIRYQITIFLVHLWVRIIIFFSGSKMTVHGKENIPDDHSYCVVGNHQGYFDIPALLLTVPWTVGFVAKMELSKIPFLAEWMKVIGVVFMDRNDKRAALDVMKLASERIKEGQPMVIFPEGTRSLGGPIKEFKQGSLKLALLAKTKILPVSLIGTWGIIEGEKKGINPADVHVYFHPVIDTAEIPEEEIPFLGERLREIIKGPVEAHGYRDVPARVKK